MAVFNRVKSIGRADTEQNLALPLVEDSASWDIINGYTRASKVEPLRWTTSSASDEIYCPFPTGSSSGSDSDSDSRIHGRRLGATTLFVNRPTSSVVSLEPTPTLMLRVDKLNKLHKTTRSTDISHDMEKSTEIQKHGHRRFFSAHTPKKIWSWLARKGRHSHDDVADDEMDFDSPERQQDVRNIEEALEEVTREKERQKRIMAAAARRPTTPALSMYRAQASSSTPNVSLKRSHSERRPAGSRRRPSWHDLPPPPMPLSIPLPPVPAAAAASFYKNTLAHTSAPSLSIRPPARKSSLPNLKAVAAHSRQSSASSIRTGPGPKPDLRGRQITRNLSYLETLAPPNQTRGKTTPFPAPRSLSRSGTPTGSARTSLAQSLSGNYF